MRIRTLIMVAARRTLGYRTVLWALGLGVVCAVVVGVALSYRFGGSLGLFAFVGLASATEKARLHEVGRFIWGDSDFLPNPPERSKEPPKAVDDLLLVWQKGGCIVYVIEEINARRMLYKELFTDQYYRQAVSKLSTAAALQASLARLRRDVCTPTWVVYMEVGFPFVQQSGCFVQGYLDREFRKGSSPQYDTGIVFLESSQARRGLLGAFEARPLPTRIKPLGLSLNVLCYAGVMLVVVGAFNLVKVARRDARGCCVFCGYPRGPGRCPECGGVAGASS